ncbi:MAG: hypothetical protein HYR94_19605 [Chloroflexi bacterium]|nr:hypothetical protein [Chloroflexota bacterium]
MLEVVDDGVEFNPTPTPSRGLRGLGLLGMRERLAMINGTLTIESAPGKGMRILACAPLKDEKEMIHG